MNKKGCLVILVQTIISTIMLVLITGYKEYITYSELTWYMCAYLVWTAALVMVTITTNLVEDAQDD